MKFEERDMRVYTVLPWLRMESSRSLLRTW